MILIDPITVIEVFAVKSIGLIFKLIALPFKAVKIITVNPMAMFKF